MKCHVKGRRGHHSCSPFLAGEEGASGWAVEDHGGAPPPGKAWLFHRFGGFSLFGCSWFFVCLICSVGLIFKLIITNMGFSQKNGV